MPSEADEIQDPDAHVTDGEELDGAIERLLR